LSLDEEPARETEHGDEQVDAHHLPGDDDPLLTEVDLHLIARLGLEAHGGRLGGPLLSAVILDGPLHGADADVRALLCEESLDDDGVALSL
jgi:hypothetical protein